MNLYLMRHGIAAAAERSGIGSDDERPLTPKGVKRLRRAAEGLRRLKVPVDTIVTSPLLRARQTAEIVAPALGLDGHIEEMPELAPQHSVDRLISAVTHFSDREHLLLVGHNPLLSRTFSFLITGNEMTLAIELKKGGLCRIETDGLPPATQATLHWFLTPKQLRLLGD